jgi:hypothetical protein
MAVRLGFGSGERITTELHIGYTLTKMVRENEP